MDWRAFGLGVAFVTMWASAFTSARIIVTYAPPFYSLSIRFVLSALIALAIGWTLGQGLPRGRAQWIAVAIFGLCQNALYLGLNFLAMRTVEASLAAIIASMLPLVVAGLSWVFLRERLTPLAAAGLVAGFVGVLVIMTARLEGGPSNLAAGLCVIAVIALSVATLLVRGASGAGNLWIVVGLQMLVGAALLMPVAVLTEEFVVVWNLPLVLAFVYTVLFPGIAATMLWFVLVGRIGATRAATFHFLNPFIGVATAAVILAEPVTVRDGIGVTIIMAGILAVQISRRAPVRPVA